MRPLNVSFMRRSAGFSKAKVVSISSADRHISILEKEIADFLKSFAPVSLLDMLIFRRILKIGFFRMASRLRYESVLEISVRVQFKWARRILDELQKNEDILKNCGAKRK